MGENMGKPRYEILDTIRAITVISMILYHLTWDLVYLHEMDWGWYKSTAAYVWQQSICWTFILLSGFCFSMGKKKWKRSLTVFFAGILVMLVTGFFTPDSRVVFGVLTMLGSSMLIMTVLDKLALRIRPDIGLIGSMLLFLAFRDVNEGYLGFEEVRLYRLPDGWYKNLLTTYVGLPYREFFSTDYFSLIPWFFLFGTGYYLYQLMRKKEALSVLERGRRVPVISFIG
ncbi:MAG: DUF1624 domain-containing protein, partial [Lachnospiraceae bacterium]|nr:DUF1624 domain-containing protein [Lachnospiraceae bacterium]